MSDADFMAWVQKAQTFDVGGTPGQKAQIIPAEWNYYGGMEMNIVDGAGDRRPNGRGEIYSQPEASVPSTSLLGADLKLYVDTSPTSIPKVRRRRRSFLSTN